MNYLDIVLWIILAIGFFNGLRRGLVMSAFSLAGVILGIVLATRFYPTFSDSTIVRVITFIVIFVLVAWFVSFLGSLVRKVVKLVMLGWVDHIAGALFGLAMSGMAIALGLVAYLHFFGPPSLILDSLTYKVLVDKLPWILGWLSDRFGGTLKPYF